jgi:hypothetical protein
VLPPDSAHPQGSWPLYRIDADGAAHAIGELRALSGEPFQLMLIGDRPAFTQGEFAEGLYPGLPWFLDDLRPQGFLGDALVRRKFPSRPPAPPRGGPTAEMWSSADHLCGLLDHGEDLTSDLVLGNASLQRALEIGRAETDCVTAEKRKVRYPQLAAASLRGERVGPMVGGAQPKFAITLQHADYREPVIVKFSDRVASPAGRRWADLLISEHHAGVTLRDHGIAAAQTQLIEADQRVFLQSTRFDRTRVLGRRGVVSLAALDAAYYGHGRIDWWRLAPQLQRDGWLTSEDSTTLSLYSWFGTLIANADMHLGNASLHLADERPLALSPSYDMLPMRFRPSVRGEIVERRYEITMPTPEQHAHWQQAAIMARDFWQRVAGDPRISAGFRAIADDASISVQRALAHLST